MNAPIVDDMVEVQCSCGRFHRLPRRIREFRCACHMTIGVNIDPYISSEFIAPLPALEVQMPRLPLPAPKPLPKLPTIERPGLGGRPNFGLPTPAPEGDEWKNEMLDVMERVAELEDLLHLQQEKLDRMQRLEEELEEARESERRCREALDNVKPILEDWEQLEVENARLSRLISVARDRGRVNLEDLFRRKRMLNKLDLFE